ncbi:hypothetical protein PHMEG_00023427 [Phytophthora megakarya]|uniref:Uncharacterized protein n=1 Tax=Phytophthora megakarya TaxID=4795 RepID=A0A225VHP8_9STRA|nr:hypothetical protein PHMEG_00023427 [Phytophthora megakarya]
MELHMKDFGSGFRCFSAAIVLTGTKFMTHAAVLTASSRHFLETYSWYYLNKTPAQALSEAFLLRCVWYRLLVLDIMVVDATLALLVNVLPTVIRT